MSKSKYRIKETSIEGQSKIYTVEKKGWFFWYYKGQSCYFGTHMDYYYSLEGAKNKIIEYKEKDERNLNYKNRKTKYHEA